MNAWYILASVQHQLCILEYALQTNSLAGWSSDLSLTDDSENFDPTSPEANNLALMCGMQSLKKDLKMINFRLQSIEQLLSTSKCMVNLTL
jgi:hypothetical protein